MTQYVLGGVIHVTKKGSYFLITKKQKNKNRKKRGPLKKPFPSYCILYLHHLAPKKLKKKQVTVTNSDNILK
jgi:hypothetical protein